MKDLEEYLKSGNYQTMLQEKLSDSGWVLGDERLLSLKEKVERVGKPLRAWDVRIYFGIKTGFNKAFIIDNETQDRILASCRGKEERERTKEIIKPVLRGEDIERWRYKWAGLWVIGTFSGWTRTCCNIRDCEVWFKHSYPSLYMYLVGYIDRENSLGRNIVNRPSQGDFWWEIQTTYNVFAELENEKIVWRRVTKSPKFAIVPSGYYCEASTHFITTCEDAFYIRRYLLGIFNSKFFEFAFYKFYMGGGVEGEIKGEFIGRYPIPPQDHPIADQIVQKVDKILTFTQSADYEFNLEKQQKVKELEGEIDGLVYELYGVTEKEVRLIESNDY